MTDHQAGARISPLHDIHVAAGAAFTNFAGWQMPVRYNSELEEHHSVRSAAGIFDLSHMAEIEIGGPDAGAMLDYALSNIVSTLGLGQARYSLVLSPEGGIIDDVIVYRTRESGFTVVANAGNRFEAVAALKQRASDFDVSVIDTSDDVALIAVQGPTSPQILAALAGLNLPVPAAELKNYWSTTGTWNGNEIMVARTGYTGENGFELYLATEFAPALWNALMEAGRPHGVSPAGLACRDTLRLEAGMPLYGHELGLDMLPAQAGLDRSVKLEGKGDFVGRSAIEASLSEDIGPTRKLVGLTSEGRRAGRAGYPVLDADGAEVGVVTSGALSPTLGHPIAMAFVDARYTAPGSELAIDVRGKPMPASVVALPFYQRPAPDKTTERKAQ